MRNYLKISVIAINYNGIKDTRELLYSFREHVKSVEYQFIVVDNASKNNEGKLLQSEFPWATVICSKENLGYAGGNNLGIAQASAPYILFINNDTIVCDDNMHLLVERLAQNPLAAGVCPKIKFSFEPNNFQFAGYTPLTPITLRNGLIGFDEPDRGQYEQARKTPYMHGAAMMVKKSVIDEVGGIPEIFFLYYEELEWSCNITNKGYELWYEPGCTVFHKESQTTGQESPLRTFYINRNRLLFAYRNRIGFTRILSMAYLAGVIFPKEVLKFLIARKPNLAKSTIRGFFSFCTMKNKKS